jgi:hypothetical protein
MTQLANHRTPAPPQDVTTAPKAGDPLTIPPRDRPNGPLSRRRLRRTALGYTALFVLGALVHVLSTGPGGKALGLGLIAPGGGQVAAGQPIGVLAVVLLFLISCVAFFGSGMVVAPIAVWLGSAAVAAATIGEPWAAAGPVVLAGVPTLVATALVAAEISFRRASARRVVRNAYLEDLRFDPPVKDGAPPVGELDDHQLEWQRHLLDLALQPVGSFDGFRFIDQFQTASVRYQLNQAQYALAMSQYTATPAFTGYLSDAQVNLIDKMQDRRVWSYWFWENLWGNFGWDPDPIPRDNIMFGGYLGVMVGTYMSTTGDHRFDEPGYFTYRWSDTTQFAYTFTEIMDWCRKNFSRYDYGMFPCEPNWIYSMCNVMGICALQLHDRLYGTDWMAGIDAAFRHSCTNEFLTPDGRLITIRSSRFGFTIPSLTSTMADAGNAWFMSAPQPDLAARTWEIVRREFVHLGEGGVRIDTRGWDILDTGSYALNGATPPAIIMMAAKEHGDPEVYEAVRAHVDQRFEPQRSGGRFRYAGISNQVNSVYALAAFNRRLGWHDLLARGVPEEWHAAPVLAEAAYPDVRVARAVTDGRDLRLVLRPGDAPTRSRLRVGRLVPGREYALTGAVERTVTADSGGQAFVDVDLEGRREVALSPLG